MEQEVTIIDVLKAFEPTGFSSGATVVLGVLAFVFIFSLFSLFGYIMMNLIIIEIISPHGAPEWAPGAHWPFGPAYLICRSTRGSKILI